MKPIRSLWPAVAFRAVPGGTGGRPGGIADAAIGRGTRSRLAGPGIASQHQGHHGLQVFRKPGRRAGHHLRDQPGRAAEIRRNHAPGSSGTSARAESCQRLLHGPQPGGGARRSDQDQRRPHPVPHQRTADPRSAGGRPDQRSAGSLPRQRSGEDRNHQGAGFRPVRIQRILRRGQPDHEEGREQRPHHERIRRRERREGQLRAGDDQTRRLQSVWSGPVPPKAQLDHELPCSRLRSSEIPWLRPFHWSRP